MALVAFDLDNTLGYFEHIGPWAEFFSVETLENQFNSDINPKFYLSDSLRRKLRRAERRFVEKVLLHPRLLETVLRPNLDAMIHPLIKGKRDGTVRAVCIYSNTWNTFSVHAAKQMIETLYRSPGFFDAVVDASHPLRDPDWHGRRQGEQVKTFKVLRQIFRVLCGVRGTIQRRDVLFVDDRPMKHLLQEDEREGLTYLKPSEFFPRIKEAVKAEAFRLGMETLEEEGLLEDRDYLESDVFRCLKYGDTFNSFVPISNVGELLKLVEENIRRSGQRWVTFNDDTYEIRRCIHDVLMRNQSRSRRV
jgi:hypothetical protein